MRLCGTPYLSFTSKRCTGSEVPVSNSAPAWMPGVVRGASRHAEVRVAVLRDLLGMPVVRGREARGAERRERVRGDDGGVALADDDDGGHLKEARKARRSSSESI